MVLAGRGGRSGFGRRRDRGHDAPGRDPANRLVAGVGDMDVSSGVHRDAARLAETRRTPEIVETIQTMAAVVSEKL